MQFRSRFSPEAFVRALPHVGTAGIGALLGALVALSLRPAAAPVTAQAQTPPAPVVHAAPVSPLASTLAAPPAAALRSRRRAPEPSRVPDLAVGPTQYALHPRSGYLLLPPQGSGYYHFGGTDEPDEDAWGQAVTIACLELVGERWLAQFPERARLGYGDISRKTGGRFPPHAEHRLGLDIDIRPVRSDDAEEKVHLGDQAFSREQTKDLVGLFESTCAVHRILFNDHRIAAESERVERARGHGNHLHVALAGPEHQPDAVRERAERLYRWSVLWSPAPRVTAGR